MKFMKILTLKTRCHDIAFSFTSDKKIRMLMISNLGIKAFSLKMTGILAPKILSGLIYANDVQTKD